MFVIDGFIGNNLSYTMFKLLVHNLSCHTVMK
jgi:hypothetical protein